MIKGTNFAAVSLALFSAFLTLSSARAASFVVEGATGTTHVEDQYQTAAYQPETSWIVNNSGVPSLSAINSAAWGTSSAEVQGSPLLVFASSIQGSGFGVPDTYAHADLIYYFAVLGPANSTALVDISGAAWAIAAPGQAEPGGGNFPVAEAGISIPVAGVDVTAAMNTSYYPSSVTIDKQVLVNTNTNYLVELSASTYMVGAQSPYPPNVAAADPYIYLDPTFAANNPGYSVGVSDGVDNSQDLSGTPEPSTFLLAGTGMMLMIFLGTRMKAGGSTI